MPAVEILRKIGQQHIVKAAAVEQRLESSGIGSRKVAGDDVDHVVGRGIHGHMAHNGVQGAKKSLVLRAAVAGRRNGNDGGRHFRVFVLELLDDGGHILADGFGQAGGGNADHLGVVQLDEVFKPLEQVLGAAEYRAFFRKRRRGDIYRLIVVGCHVPPNIGAASLRTVQNAHALADAVKGAYRTHGHAHLAGICIQVDKIGAHCLLLCSRRPVAAAAGKLCASRLRCARNVLLLRPVLRAPGWPAPALPRQMRQSCA